MRVRVRVRQAIEENKRVLRDKFGAAKALGERVNAARGNINYLKSSIEHMRVERAMQVSHSAPQNCAHIVLGEECQAAWLADLLTYGLTGWLNRRLTDSLN